jgi:hypothetical protein
VLQVLQEAGAELDNPDALGLTPLMHAVAEVRHRPARLA